MKLRKKVAKILWVIIVLTIGLASTLFAPIESELTEEKEKMYKQIAYNKAKRHLQRNYEEKSDMYKDKDYFFYKDKMPREYLEIFLLSTENIKEKRILIYSMMIVESMGFKEYSNTNENKTTDHGPLMLNSENINCVDFNSKFFPKEDFLSKLKESDITDQHILYIPACINLLKAHLRMYNGDVKKSLKAYNGGPKVNRKKYKGTRLDYKTTRYYNKCMIVYNRVKADYNKFDIENKNKTAFDLYEDNYFNFENNWDSYLKYKKLMIAMANARTIR